jgi:hypothetical protein
MEHLRLKKPTAKVVVSITENPFERRRKGRTSRGYAISRGEFYVVEAVEDEEKCNSS